MFSSQKCGSKTCHLQKCIQYFCWGCGACRPRLIRFGHKHPGRTSVRSGGQTNQIMFARHPNTM